MCTICRHISHLSPLYMKCGHMTTILNQYLLCDSQVDLTWLIIWKEKNHKRVTSESLTYRRIKAELQLYRTQSKWWQCKFIECDIISAVISEWAVGTNHEEHLSLVVVRKEEQSVDGVQRNLVVVCLTMSPYERWVYFDSVSTPGERRIIHTDIGEGTGTLVLDTASQQMQQWHLQWLAWHLLWIAHDHGMSGENAKRKC